VTLLHYSQLTIKTMLNYKACYIYTVINKNIFTTQHLLMAINHTYKTAVITFARTQWNALADLTNVGRITQFLHSSNAPTGN